MKGDKIKVLYIAAGWRSGSTLIDNVLGQIDKFFSAGELFYVWEDNLIHNRPCGCHRPFEECAVWQNVMYEAYGGINSVDAHEMVRMRDSSARTRHVPLLMLPAHKSILKRRLGRYLDNLEKLYHAIVSSTGSRVVVDSSKLPFYGYLLGMLPSIDLYVIHLVRDPRAVAFSRQRKKYQPDVGKFLPIKNPVISSITWNIVNLAVETFWKSSNNYMMLRYEDFIKNPQETLERIFSLVKETPPQLAFMEDHEVLLEATHTVSGNPGRFRTGKMKLLLDEEWKPRMRRSHRRAVTALTLPLLLRYGYLDSKRSLLNKLFLSPTKPAQLRR